MTKFNAIYALQHIELRGAGGGKGGGSSMSSGRSIILVLSAVITHGTTDPPAYGSSRDSQYENEKTL